MNHIVKKVLAGAAVVAVIGAGAAYAGRGGMAHESFGGGPGMKFQRLCATDQGYISGRIAQRLTARLKLTDSQKASLTDLQDTFVKAATQAKAICNETPDMATIVGRLASAEKRTEATLAVIKAVRPKLETFYAGLDDTQKAAFDRIGPRGRFMHRHGDHDDNRGAPKPG